MSARLIGDLIEWRRTPKGSELTQAEFIVLAAIADRVLDEKTRLMRRFKGDDCDLHERICQVAGLNSASLKKVLQKLAARGLDVRVEIGKDAIGRPLYACKGRAMSFQFPELPASVTLAPVSQACG